MDRGRADACTFGGGGAESTTFDLKIDDRQRIPNGVIHNARNAQQRVSCLYECFWGNLGIYPPAQLVGTLIRSSLSCFKALSLSGSILRIFIAYLAEVVNFFLIFSVSLPFPLYAGFFATSFSSEAQ